MSGAWLNMAPSSVPEFMKIERYSHVMHLVSSVKGTLRLEVRADRGAFRCLPGWNCQWCPEDPCYGDH